MSNLTTPPTSPTADDGNATPRRVKVSCDALITDAYFAKKVVTETNGATRVALSRINTHILGRVLYVVVDTLAIAGGESVTIRLVTNDKRLTGTSQQTLSVTNGSADVASFTGRIGDTTALDDNTGACAYTNLKDFAAKVIFKLTLRPHARADFDRWAQHIRDAGAELPSIRLEVSCDRAVPFATPARANLTLENKIVYEIQHGENAYNFLPVHTLNGTSVRKRIAQVENTFTTRVKYYFWNRIDNCHDLCEVEQSRVRRRANGQHVARAPAGYIESAKAPGGDSDTNYYYNQGADTTPKTPRWQYFQIVTTGKPGTKYGIVSYDLANPNDPLDMVSLVRMPDNLSYDAELGRNRVWATFSYSGTQRRYCNPGCFAGFLGALIQLGRRDIVCTGMCFGDATSYPSVAHPNGDSVDTTYLSSLADEQRKVDALRDHYFTKIRRGSANWQPSLRGTVYTKGHDTHLHAEDFAEALVVVLNPA